MLLNIISKKKKKKKIVNDFKRICFISRRNFSMIRMDQLDMDTIYFSIDSNICLIDWQSFNRNTRVGMGNVLVKKF